MQQELSLPALLSVSDFILQERREILPRRELGKALDNSYKNAQDVASDKYINPTARFQGSIVKDVNGTIIGIVFAQV